jgi:NAD(P)H-flavin reductase/ferredoxin/truncated hemoglobin YjbI
MPRLVYQNIVCENREGESVLETLLRHGINVPFSCRSGICHACLQRCESGPVPEKAQSGIRPTLRAQGYFLPCTCVPVGDMEIAPPRPADLYSPAVVYAKELLAPDVLRVLLEPATALSYQAGQFINLRRNDGLVRSYSLASEPSQDYFLELHVRRMKNGAMSNWIFDALQVSDEIEIQGPQGHCVYTPGDGNQNILLIAAGTGLAPLYGIARAALRSGHAGEIHLYHGTRHPVNLYLRDTLIDLGGKHRNFQYVSCVSGKDVPPGVLAGRPSDVAFSLHPHIRGWRVYAAGLPAMVRAVQAAAFGAGVEPADIYMDPFEYKDLRRHKRPEPGPVAHPVNVAPQNETPASVPPQRGRNDPPPDPELWAALGDGELLMEILVDFYTQVYDDARLAPFFHGITRQRSIEKQYLFLRQVFTGNKVYIGDRPRNAHHWMVISEELFDYREEIMMACLRRHGLPEPLIQRWRAVEENYRADIVKTQAFKRVIDGMELPMDGFGETIMEVGTLCDSCNREIHPGEHVRYHLRLGTTYCSRCSLVEAQQAAPAGTTNARSETDTERDG